MTGKKRKTKIMKKKKREIDLPRLSEDAQVWLGGQD